MKQLFLTLMTCLAASMAFADNILTEGFEYGNQDLGRPCGWVSDDNAWLSGYLEKDHNRKPHTGSWYAFSTADDSWMYMPLYLIPGNRFLFSCWAVSDGSGQLEFWAGSSPAPDDMHTLLMSATVGNEGYERFEAYVTEVPDGCEYVGVRALIGNDATCITIDDIYINMVRQYDFEARVITGDTAMLPGSQGVFRFMVYNLGYDELDIMIHPSDEFFTGIHCYADGAEGTVVHTQPGDRVTVTVNATLRPEVQPGAVTWLDVHLTIPCGCNTALATFWVTPIAPELAAENTRPEASVYPNPAWGVVTVEAEGLQNVTLFDAAGRTIKSVPANGNALQLDLTDLKAGIYFISAKTRSTSAFVKSILKM